MAILDDFGHFGDCLGILKPLVPQGIGRFGRFLRKKVLFLLNYFLQTFFKEMYPNRPIPWGSKDYKIPKVSKTNPL